MAEQLPFNFDLKADQSFNSFYAGNNQQAVEYLTEMANGKGEQQIYLWSTEGLGKTHLLQACCQQAHQQKIAAFYLDLAKDFPLDSSILEGLENFSLVCIDNIENCTGNAVWEMALFNFYNQHRENGHRLILSANCPPNYLALDLPDLKTRMSWGLTLKLQELSESESIAAFTCKANYLGFEISPKVGQFLSKHYARDLPTLWRLLPELERATLIAKRKLSVPLLKKILADENFKTVD